MNDPLVTPEQIVEWARKSGINLDPDKHSSTLRRACKSATGMVLGLIRSLHQPLTGVELFKSLPTRKYKKAADLSGKARRIYQDGFVLEHGVFDYGRVFQYDRTDKKVFVVFLWTSAVFCPRGNARGEPADNSLCCELADWVNEKFLQEDGELQISSADDIRGVISKTKADQQQQWLSFKKGKFEKVPVYRDPSDQGGTGPILPLDGASELASFFHGEGVLLVGPSSDKFLILSPARAAVIFSN